MKCTLVQKVEVTQLAVLVEFAWLEKRTELGLLCRLAQQKGALSVALLREALPGTSEAGARNILAWCVRFGLCDANGALTEHGTHAAATDEVPIPEQGVFDLWIVQHPLLGTRIVHAERVAPQRDARFEAMEEVAINLPKHQRFSSVMEASSFILRDVLSHGPRVPLAMVRGRGFLQLEWKLDLVLEKQQWSLSGTLPSFSVPLQMDSQKSALSLSSLSRALFQGPLSSHGQWNQTTGRLGVSFEKITPKEQDTFEKNFVVKSIDLPQAGSWAQGTFEAVPIEPRSSIDAQRWSIARLERKLSAERRYYSRETLRKEFYALQKDTALVPFRPMLPSHTELLAQCANNPELSWRLAAAVDLATEIPSPEMLGSFELSPT